METDRNEAETETHEAASQKHASDQAGERTGSGHQTAGKKGVARFARKTGKAVIGAAGIGVIAKDIKRVRPRYPKMWKDIVSVNAWRERLRKPEMRKTPLVKDVIVNLVTVGFSGLLVMYGIGLASSAYWQSMPTVNKAGLFVIILLAGIQMICHLMILALKTKKYVSQGNQSVKQTLTAKTSGLKE